MQETKMSTSSSHSVYNKNGNRIIEIMTKLHAIDLFERISQRKVYTHIYILKHLNT